MLQRNRVRERQRKQKERKKITIFSLGDTWREFDISKVVEKDMRETENDWLDTSKDLESVLFQVGDQIFDLLIADVVLQLNKIEAIKKRA